MSFSSFICLVLYSSFAPRVAASPKQQLVPIGHDAIGGLHMGDVQDKIPRPAPIVARATSAPITVYTVITPSPGASVVEVTQQSQVVETFVPEATMCAAKAPFQNFSSAVTGLGGTGACEIYYRSTETTVCATTLTGIATLITISDCDQQVTFSTEYGYSLQMPTPTTNGTVVITPAPSIVTQIMYLLAPWQSLLAGNVPTAVDSKVCTPEGNDTLECINYEEVWAVYPVNSTTTSTSTVDLTTTVTGPGVLKIETIHINIAETVTVVTLTTTLLLQSYMETETTVKSTSKAASTSAEFTEAAFPTSAGPVAPAFSASPGIYTNSTSPTGPANTTIFTTIPVRHALTQLYTTSTIVQTHLVTVVTTVTMTRPRPHFQSL